MRDTILKEQKSCDDVSAPEPVEGNLHIRVEGRFSRSLAMDLVSVIRNNFHGNGTVYIHTGAVTSVEPLAGEMFAELLDVAGVSREFICLTGEFGSRIWEKGNHLHTEGCRTCKRCRQKASMAH